MRLGMLQGMGLRMLQLRLGVRVRVLELERRLGFELVHTGRSIIRKHLWGGASESESVSVCSVI